MALGAACGLLNGVLVTWGQVPALVVTLGTLYVFRGLAFLWTNGTQVNAETLPDAFLNLGTDSIARRPDPRDHRARRDGRSSASGCATTAPGRELYAIGSNPEGARLAGVRSDRRVLTAFVLAGALAGLGGVLFTARFGTVDATAGVGYELTVIAAAVVGGVAIFGGTGSVYGAALGALLLGTITSSLIVLQGRRLLAAGRDRRAAAARDRLRPARRPARRGRPAPEERAPCRLRPHAAQPADAAPPTRREALAPARARSGAGRRCSSG